MLRRSTKTWSPNDKLQDPSTVDYDTPDEKDASEHQVLWSNLMNKGKYLDSSGYHHVEVLLLCWDQECVDMATQEEVDKLKIVFEEKFGYHATIAKLKLRPGGPLIQVQVNFEVAQFVRNHDGQNNLLIVYYAGHGKPGRDYGKLELFGFVPGLVHSLQLLTLNLQTDLAKRPERQTSTPARQPSMEQDRRNIEIRWGRHIGDFRLVIPINYV